MSPKNYIRLKNQLNKDKKSSNINKYKTTINIIPITENLFMINIKFVSDGAYCVVTSYSSLD